MIEELSPSLSAFWATVSLMVLMITQRVLTAFFRSLPPCRRVQARRGEVIDGLNDGARNMIGIAIATGTAGIIVGGITLTGLGLRMTDFVEVVSQGNVIAMLLFTAFVCLVLGLGVPTTANYILVATLMAPVIVELGAQSGADHSADRGAPLRLLLRDHGRHHAAGRSRHVRRRGDLRRGPDQDRDTGVDLRAAHRRAAVRVHLQPALLMIDVHGWWEIALVSFAATVASCIFAAATMGWFQTRCRWWEVVVLLVATFALFRPDFFMSYIAEPYRDAPARRDLRRREVARRGRSDRDGDRGHQYRRR